MDNAATADLTALAQDLTYASQQGYAQAATQVIQQAAQQVQKIAQTLVPVKSGALRDSITIRYPDVLSAEIGPTLNYGTYQEYGTGTRGEFPTGMYQIKPVRARALVFKVSGKKVYAKIVNHPGIRPRPFMRPALVKVLGDQLTEDMLEAGVLAITRGRS